MSTINPTIESARLAAEAVREINHRRGGYTWPSDTCDVIGELARLCHGLPQVLGQMSSWLLAEHAAGRVRAVAGPTDVAIKTTVEALAAAADAAVETGQALDVAHATTADLSAAAS